MIEEFVQQRLDKIRGEIGLPPMGDTPPKKRGQKPGTRLGPRGPRADYRVGSFARRPQSLREVKQRPGQELILTEKEERFVQAVSQGMTKRAAAVAAGYVEPGKSAARLMKRPAVVAAVRKEQKVYEKSVEMTRKQVMDGFLEAIGIARIQADSVSMISGWREVGKMCGYYEPVRHQIDISVNGQAIVSRIQSLSDAELLQLAESEKGEALEAEFKLLPEPEEAETESES